MVGLVGESGSGKSVTARTVLGLWPERSEVDGSVRVGGREVLGASRDRLLELRRSEVVDDLPGPARRHQPDPTGR